MKWMHRLNTVFYRLIISYTVLIMIIIGTVGSGSYIYFSSSLNEQIEKMNQSSLHQMSDSILQHVVELSEKTYVNLIMNRRETNDVLQLFDKTYESDYASITNVHDRLISEHRSQLDLINSIEMYYISNELGISSHTGVTFYREPRATKPKWLKSMEEERGRSPWISSENSEGAATATFVRAYPYTEPKEIAKGYVAITVKPEAIAKIVRSSALPESGSLLLLDEALRPIVANGAPVTDERYAVLSDILAGSKAEGNELMDSKAGSSIVSYTTVPGTGWKIISITPVHEFYKKSIALRNTLILLCIAAILVGIVIAHIFTWNLYNPIKRLFQAASALLGHTPATKNKSVNEISYINFAINNLSVKVNKLESTLQNNLPLIKHHIVHSLLYKSFSSGDELDERMSLLHLQWSHARYCCVRLRFDPAQFMAVDVQNKHFIKYNLLEELESFRTEKLLVLAIEISETDIGCIFGLESVETAQVESVMESIVNYCHSNFLLRPSVAVGSYVDQLRNLDDSFRETEMILKYAYFRNETVLSGRRHLDRETYQASLPLEIMTDFDGSLQRGDIAGIKEALGSLKTFCQDGSYSADRCHEAWMQLVACFHRNMQEAGIQSEDVIVPELQEKLRTSRHMSQFEEWLIESVCRFFELQEQKIESRKYEVVEKARQYIEDHLQEPLSLEIVAEQVHLMPRYLSRLFKEESGSTFTEYVTHIRLNKAKELIETTPYSVEQISVLAGFSSSAYFIRKFKEAFGWTPKVYKSRLP